MNETEHTKKTRIRALDDIFLQFLVAGRFWLAKQNHDIHGMQYHHLVLDRVETHKPVYRRGQVIAFVFTLIRHPQPQRKTKVRQYWLVCGNGELRFQKEIQIAGYGTVPTYAAQKKPRAQFIPACKLFPDKFC